MNLPRITRIDWISNMLNTPEELNDLTYKIRGCIFEVFNTLGPGLLESIYEKALMLEFKAQGISAMNQVTLPATYKGVDLQMDLRLDILVENQVVIELKSVEKLLPVHFKQIDTYLKLADKQLGFLVNFNTNSIYNEIRIFKNKRI